MNKKIKICFIQTNSYALFNKNKRLNHGGSEIQLYFLSKELAKDREFDVSFVVGDFNQSDIEIIDKIKIFKAQSPINGSSLFLKIKQAFLFWKIFSKINADIYFTSTANGIAGVVGVFCKLKNKKHIHRTASDMDVNKEFIKKNGLNGKIYEYGLEKTDIVIVQSKEHQKLLKENHSINSFVIKNSFDLRETNKKIKKTILWVSRCHPLKKPEFFLNLAEKFTQEKFIIICPPSDGFKEFFKIIRNRAEKIKNIEFIDFVSFDKIQKYYNEAKIFVNTSDYEGFPNTFIQSCIGETPIISLRVNPDNFLNKYNCGYCADGDFNKLVQQTEALLKNKKNWKEKSQNARKYVEENHDIRKNIVDLKKIIKNLS